MAGKLPAGFSAAYLWIEPDNGCEFQQFQPFRTGNYNAYVEDNYAFCRFNLSFQVDLLIIDMAIGMAPDLFPGQTGTCFAKVAE